MKSSLFMLALATSATSFVIKRDFATIEADIGYISSNLTALTTAVNNYQTIADASPLISAEGALDSAIKQGTADAKATTSVTNAQTQAILNDVNNLIPNVVTALNAVTNKQAAFSSSGVSGIVTGDIQQLQTDTDAFANALIALAPAAYQAQAQAAKSCIDAAFNASLAGKQASASCASSGSSSSSVAPTSTTPPATSSTPAPTTLKTTSAPPTTSKTTSAARTTSKTTSALPTTSVVAPTSVPVTSAVPTSAPAGSVTVTKTVSLPGGTTTVAGPTVTVTAPGTTVTATKTVTVTGAAPPATSTCANTSKCTKPANLLAAFAMLEQEFAQAVICYF